MHFKSTVLLVPGLGNSEEDHWQSYWERLFDFHRVHQLEWDTPNCIDWIIAIDQAVTKHDPGQVILVGHSLGCAAIAFWADKYRRSIKGALLVAPSDTEKHGFPAGTTGFIPMILNKLPFPSIVVSSTGDAFVAPERAEHFASCWGSKFVSIGNTGHINAASNLKEWPQGQALLKELDE